jgi:RHS repeat-associated protein
MVTVWNHLFQGLKFTETTGLAYVRHRDYSATLGRFIERDPIGFRAGDNNWYRFVGNVPSALTDPFGMQPPGSPQGPCPPQPNQTKCEELLAEITEVIQGQKGLSQRYWRMIYDEDNLYYNKPTGKNSWEGHQLQYENERRRLNRLYREYLNEGCKDPTPPGTGGWLTRPAPTAPWSVTNPGMEGPPYIPGVPFPGTAVPVHPPQTGQPWGVGPGGAFGPIETSPTPSPQPNSWGEWIFGPFLPGIITRPQPAITPTPSPGVSPGFGFPVIIVPVPVDPRPRGLPIAFPGPDFA